MPLGQDNFDLMQLQQLQYGLNEEVQLQSGISDSMRDLRQRQVAYTRELEANKGIASLHRHGTQLLQDIARQLAAKESRLAASKYRQGVIQSQIERFNRARLAKVEQDRDLVRAAH